MEAKEFPVIGGLIELEPANSKAFVDKETKEKVVYPRQDQITISVGRKTYSLPLPFVKLLIETAFKDKEFKTALDVKGGIF